MRDFLFEDMAFQDEQKSLIDKLQEERLTSACKYVLDDERGRAFVMLLLDKCGLYRYCDEPTDEGARRVGVSLCNTFFLRGFYEDLLIAEKEDYLFKQRLSAIGDKKKEGLDVE